MSETFTEAEIVPIPAKCPKCKFDWVKRDAIRAPSLMNCRCFWCGSRLIRHPSYPRVVDALTRRRQRVTFVQAPLIEDPPTVAANRGAAAGAE